MVAKLASRLVDFFEERTDGNIRSIIAYGEDEHEVYYIRDDVAGQYDEAEFENSIEDTRLDSLSRPIYESTFSEEHGDLTCLVQAFENAVEMNFIIGDGRGVAVGLDAEALEETHGLVAQARDIVLEERTNTVRTHDD